MGHSRCRWCPMECGEMSLAQAPPPFLPPPGSFPMQKSPARSHPDETLIIYCPSSITPTHHHSVWCPTATTAGASLSLGVSKTHHYRYSNKKTNNNYSTASAIPLRLTTVSITVQIIICTARPLATAKPSITQVLVVIHLVVAQTAVARPSTAQPCMPVGSRGEGGHEASKPEQPIETNP